MPVYTGALLLQCRAVTVSPHKKAEEWWSSGFLEVIPREQSRASSVHLLKSSSFLYQGVCNSNTCRANFSGEQTSANTGSIWLRIPRFQNALGD